jgi:serine/threonine kinase 16
MVRLFKGTCEAVRAMHDYRAPIASGSNPRPSRENQSSSAPDRRSQQPRANIRANNGHSDDEDDEMFPQPEGDAEGGYSYHGPAEGNGSSVPLMSRGMSEGEAIFDGDEELENIQRSGLENGAASGQTELVPYAHRDLKPG